MNTKEVLIAARKKIERPECWTKGVQARDAIGAQVHRDDAKAVSWCAIGAVWSVAGGGYRHTLALKRGLPDGFRLITAFNDDGATTHAEVLAMFDRAIEACAP